MQTGKVFDLGRQGDGLLKVNGQNIFISNVLPDEEIEYSLISETRAKLEKVITPSPMRAEPICPYFEKCGGCTLQHLNEQAYQEFKLRYFKELLPKDWTDFELDMPFFAPAQSRRRVSFAIAWNGLARWFGLNPKDSEKVLNIETCAILVPELNKLIQPLRRFLSDSSFAFPKKKGVGDVSLLQTQTGVDILFTLPFAPSFEVRQNLANFAFEHDIARISWRYSERHESEPLAMLRAPTLSMGEFSLKPPSGVFLQPSLQGQNALIESVIEYVGKAKKVVDLFCGAGTFSLPLLKKKRIIEGADNAQEALDALKTASSNRIKLETRDLFKTPLYVDELDKFDAIIFDPPRAGAKAQCEQIADSEVPVVVAVSCNPTSFVKDAQTLMNGGYKLKRLRPIDQFVFTPHMELVALFEKCY